MSTKKFVDDAIEQNDVVVFAKSWCPYCKRARDLLEGLPAVKDKSYKVYDLDKMDDGADIQAYLGDKSSQRTVPNIYIHQQHVGGNDDLQAANRSGKLKELLANAV